MAATQYAVLQRQPGASVVTAWPQVTPNAAGSQNLDLIQIVGEGAKVLANVSYTGAVTLAPTTPTNGTRIGVFYSRLTTSATLAQLFADAFENLSQQDIIQVQNIGGTISYYLSYAGVATGS